MIVSARHARMLAAPLVLLAAQTAHAMELFVAPNGKDANPGTRARPLASLEAARDRLRAAPKGPHVLTLKAGAYYRSASLALDARDSGLTVRGEPGAEVRLIGGVPVRGGKVSDDPRLPEAARGKVLEIALEDLGVTDPGALVRRGFGVTVTPPPCELLRDGKPLTLARWPNGDAWATIKTTPGGQSGATFTLDADPERLARWAQADDLWTHGYWTYDWADTYEKIVAVDPATKTLTTAPPHGAYGYTAGKRFYVLNALEELDDPDEYYIDRKKKALFCFASTHPLALSTLTTPLVTVRDAEKVTLERLTLACARGTGVTIDGGKSCMVAGCTLRGLGVDGIAVNGGAAHRVVACDLYDLGETGVTISGGDRMTLTPARHAVENCDIRRYSRLCFTYRPAVGINGVGNIVRNNRLHDAPHNAILLSGNDHEIAYNEIFRVCTQTGDAGAVYMGRNLTMRGNAVRYNYFHDIGPTLRSENGFVDVMAVYLDDCFCGVTIFGNIFEKAGRSAMIGGGRDNTIENNLFIDGNPAIHVDARGKGWASKYFVPNGEWRIFETLAEVKPKEPPYATRYPALAKIYDDDIAFARGNRLLRNVIVGGKPYEWQDGLTEKTIEVTGNVIVADGAAVGLDRKTFTVRAPGFVPIPFAKIGLQRGAYRPR